MHTTSTNPISIANEFAARLRETAAEQDRQRQYPDEEMALLKKSGLLGLFVPKPYGGFDADLETAVEVMALLGGANPNVAQNTQGHHCVVEGLKTLESPRFKEKYLRVVSEQGMLISNAFSEIGTQYVVTQHKVSLRPDGQNFRVNGAKFYTTGSRWADAFYVLAVEEGTGTARLVFCKPNAPGMTLHDDWDGMGQRTTSSGTLEFRDTLVSGDASFPAEPFSAPGSYLGPFAQILLAAIHLGIAREALADTLQYLRTEARPWFQSGINKSTEDAYVLHHVGGMKVAVDCADLLLKHSARALEKARETLQPEDRAAAAIVVAEAKAVTTEAALRVTNELFQICGTRSTRARWNFDRHWRNIRTLSLHDPVDYKYRMIGDYLLNGAPPPITGWT